MTTAAKTTATRNAIAAEFAEALAADFAEHGRAAIERLREKDLAVYLRLVAAIEPKSGGDASAAMDGLSDDELERMLDAVRDLLAQADLRVPDNA